MPANINQIFTEVFLLDLISIYTQINSSKYTNNINIFVY